MRRSGRERRLPAGAHQRPGGEHWKTVAAKALNGVAEAAADHRRDESHQSRRRCDEIGQGDEMDEARQPEILLGDIKMGGRGVAEARRKAALVGHDQRRARDGRQTEGDEPRSGPRRAVAP